MKTTGPMIDPRAEAPSRSWLSRVWSLAVTAIILVAAWFVWPTVLWGRTQFVVVQGTSMEPLYHTGDLLYARAADDYRVGDVAVYAVPEGETGAGSLVVHRITGVEPDGRLVFTGDNRDSSDSVRPSRDDLVARPVTNLGPLPSRLIVLMPFLLSITLGVSVMWFLWPAKAPDEAREALGYALSRIELAAAEGERTTTTNPDYPGSLALLPVPPALAGGPAHSGLAEQNPVRPRSSYRVGWDRPLDHEERIGVLGHDSHEHHLQGTMG